MTPRSWFGWSPVVTGIVAVAIAGLVVAVTLAAGILTGHVLWLLERMWR